jgi:N-acetylglucosaminyldiphosphoundecaprenol N-acetyl-beta-D-mannosaminyltransferase
VKSGGSKSEPRLSGRGATGRGYAAYDRSKMAVAPYSLRREFDRARVSMLGCPLDAVTLNQALARVEEAIVDRSTCQHVAVNAAKLVRFQGDPTLRAAINGCELITADGQAIVWAARLLGDALPERVAGIDLMAALLELASSRGYRVFILGARPAVVSKAAACIRARLPNLSLAYHHGYFASEEEDAIVRQIASASPDLLFVALETPAKELFLARHRGELDVPFVMGVGGAIDVIAGVRRRAPRWMQRAGLEWLFRFVQDPRRLARRYVVGNTRFCLLVAGELLRRRRRQAFDG